MGDAQKKTKHTGRGKGSLFLRFFLVALLLSLAVHLIFLKKAGSWKVEGFAPEGYDEIVPRTFRMKRVEIDPKTLEEAAPTPVKKKEKQPVVIEKETPKILSSQGGDAKAPVLEKPAEINLQEKPDASGTALTELAKQNGFGKQEDKLPHPDPLENPSILPADGGKNLVDKGTPTGGSKTPQFSSLDDLLAGGAPVTPDTAPILMPTDLLFEYNSSSLRPAAAESLSKLATLIARNAGSTLRIEGHTDSFGSDEYNMELSLHRAEEVKRWLQSNMGISPDRITTAGYGKSRLLVPATLSIAGQQMNRRVEIVITAPQK